MSSRRQISWSAAVRDMRADRAPAPVLVTVADRMAHHARVKAETERYTAASRALVLARLKSLVVAGRYNRAAIMRLAVAAAREMQAERSSTTWRAAMAAGLKMAWAEAYAARIAVAH